MKFPHPYRPLLEVILPAVYLAAILVWDYVIPNGLITPFFVVLALLIMAPTLRPGQMILWAVIYTGTVCSIFLFPKIYVIFAGHPYREQSILPWLRAATYVMVGGLSCYLCLALNKLREKESELADILAKLPWPILVSDHHGKILYWNEGALSFLPTLKEKKGKLSYFDLLASAEGQGRTIADYLQRIEEGEPGKPLDLHVEGRTVKGYTKLLEWADKKVLLTVLADEIFAKEGFCFSGRNKSE